MKTQDFKPILFSTEMVQAIFEGRKTQTRRVIDPQPVIGNYVYDGIDSENQKHYLEEIENGKFTERYLSVGKPKYQPGDILWVRETFIEFAPNNYEYKAGFTDQPIEWKPSIHMPKEAARIFLKVTDVRCERLQEISCQDCKQEGVVYYKQDNIDVDDILALEAFMKLWQKINAKKHPWESNPWVWVYNFKRIEKPQNFLS